MVINMKTYMVSYRLKSDKDQEFDQDQIYSNFIKANSKEEAKEKFENHHKDVYDVVVEQEMYF